jgi:hypothetical protein
MVKKTALRRLMKGLPMSVDPAALRDDGDDSLVSTQGPTTGSSGSVAQLDKPRARAPRLQQLADQVESSPSGDEPFPGEAANDGVIGFGDGGDSAI